MKGVLSSVDLDEARLVQKAQASPGLVGRDLVREVIPDRAIEWSQPLSRWARLAASGAARRSIPRRRTSSRWTTA